MGAQKNKTLLLGKKDIKLNWLILDAAGKTLGRFAAEVAKILRGKHKPSFTPYIDCGDGVIVVNADKIKVTGNKEAQKEYHHHTGSPGGFRTIPYRVMMQKKPEYIIEHAVKGMMPHSRLARQQMRKLRIHAGTKHEMIAQKPIKIEV